MGFYTDDILGSSEPSEDNRRAAAHLIELDGCDGVQSAAALVGESEAQSMLRTHVERNIARHQRQERKKRSKRTRK